MHRVRNTCIGKKILSISRLKLILCVDHAGEYGAVRIYDGQLSAFNICNKITLITPIIPIIPINIINDVKDMREHERKHYDNFTELMKRRSITPSKLLPLWNIAGFSLGWLTGICGANSAMVCTMAVEKVVVQHYNNQLSTFNHDDDTELTNIITTHRDEENTHHDYAHNHLSKQNQLLRYQILEAIIKTSSKAAISIQMKCT